MFAESYFFPPNKDLYVYIHCVLTFLGKKICTYIRTEFRSCDEFS